VLRRRQLLRRHWIAAGRHGHGHLTHGSSGLQHKDR
jgi:hypothetical protein